MHTAEVLDQQMIEKLIRVRAFYCHKPLNDMACGAAAAAATTAHRLYIYYNIMRAIN